MTAPRQAPGREAAIQVRSGIDDSLRPLAASLYAEAFAQKLGFSLGPPATATRLLAARMDTGRVLAAFVDRELVGLLGLNFWGRRFVQLRLRDLVGEFGAISGCVRGLALVPLERKARRGQLLLDGLVVARHLRGGGVGTALLAAVEILARRNGFESIRLDVVASNPRAKHLYERVGFVETAVAVLPWPFSRWIGEKAASTMVKTLTPEAKAQDIR